MLLTRRLLLVDHGGFGQFKGGIFPLVALDGWQSALTFGLGRLRMPTLGGSLSGGLLLLLL